MSTGPDGRPELYRQQVTPDMAVVADGAAVVLEISEGGCGCILRRVAVTNITGFHDILIAARAANGLYQNAADEALRERLADRRKERRA
jgi:hypothetical protein